MNILERIERIGNSLPDPITLFAAGAIGIILLSQVVVSSGWSVDRRIATEVSGQTVYIQERVEAQSLLSSDGAYFAISSLVNNFKNFPPLAIVLVGMLGIGLADRTGFISSVLKVILLAVPAPLLTPAVLMVGMLSSLALDAGYVVLPPIAAALYAAVKRSPLAGLAAVFAGVSAGFSANLVVTSLDVILATISEVSAHLLDPEYRVAATANLWFMITSTLLLTITGWAVSIFVVEPRLANKSAAEGGPPKDLEDTDQTLSVVEKRGLIIAGLVTLVTMIVFGLATIVPGAPLYGMDAKFPRWITSIVSLLFLGFLIPGLAYGFATGALKNDRDVARMLGETMASMGPYIAMAFFAAQFIEYFRYSGIGEMVAITGGEFFSNAALPNTLLILSFIMVIAASNLLVGSMSAKYVFFAPVFVPMFMQIGISPELTQAAYRVGDSVSNVITPLNPYLIIILAFVRRYVPVAGIGTIVALMLPYAIAFTIAWSILLAVWMWLGIDLGPAGPLHVSRLAP